jgi:hypothetical protein
LGFYNVIKSNITSSVIYPKIAWWAKLRVPTKLNGSAKSNLE